MTELKPITESPLAGQVVEGDYDILGVVAPIYDCCVYKVIEEPSKYISEYGIKPIVALEPQMHGIIEQFPRWIMYFRAGSMAVAPNILMNLEGHIMYFKNLDIPVIYYLDDYIWDANQGFALKLIMNSDAIIVATDALKEKLQGLLEAPTQPIYTIKTHIDLPAIDMLPLHHFSYLTDPSRYNILFTSQGRIGATMIHKIMEIMNETPEKYEDVTFTVIAHQVASMRSILNKFRRLRKVYYEYMPIQEYYAMCCLSDLILSPGNPDDLAYFLKESERQTWLDCKSCVKYTLAGAARIPVIAAPLREYKLAIKHGETGFLAETPEEWVHYIDLMHEDREQAKKIGIACRKDIEANWNIYERTAEFAKLLRELERK